MPPKIILIGSGVLLAISGLINDPLRAWPYWIIWIATCSGYLLLSKLPGDLTDELILWFCAAAALVGIAQVLSWWIGLRGYWLVAWRPASFLNNCNILAPVMLWGGLLAAKKRLYGLVVLFGITLLLTLSKTSFLALAGVVAIYVWIVLPHYRSLIVLLVSIVLLLVYILAINQDYDSLGMRVQAWKAAARVGGGVFGHGPGYLKMMIPLSQVYSDRIWHAHNLVLQVWGDLGWSGILALIGIGWLTLDDAIRSGSIWLQMYITAVLVASVLEYLYWLPGIGLLGLVIYDRLRPRE